MPELAARLGAADGLGLARLPIGDLMAPVLLTHGTSRLAPVRSLEPTTSEPDWPMTCEPEAVTFGDRLLVPRPCPS